MKKKKKRPTRKQRQDRADRLEAKTKSGPVRILKQSVAPVQKKTVRNTPPVIEISDKMWAKIMSSDPGSDGPFSEEHTAEK